MSGPVKLAVVLEGGVVQAVLTAGVPVEVVIIDYDTEGCSECGLSQVSQDDGSTEPAFVNIWPAQDSASDRAFVMRAFDLCEEGTTDAA